MFDCPVQGPPRAPATLHPLSTPRQQPTPPSLAGMQMTLSQSNIQVTGYANNLEVTYDGTTLKWVFEAPAQ